MKSYTIFEKIDEETLNVFLEWMRNQERNVYRAAVAELAALKKLRPIYVRQKSTAEQFAWLKKMLAWKPAETIGDHLLQVWLVRKHTDMLVSFLNTLGIAHNGQGVVDHLPDSLDAEKLKKGVDDLLRSTLPVQCHYTCTCSKIKPRMAGLSCRRCWIRILALRCVNFPCCRA